MSDLPLNKTSTSKLYAFWLFKIKPADTKNEKVVGNSVTCFPISGGSGPMALIPGLGKVGYAKAILGVSLFITHPNVSFGH